MKRMKKIIVITMMTVLFSCASKIKSPDTIPELVPIKKVRIAKPSLDCLGTVLKKIVVNRILDCSNRLETLKGQIKAHNKRTVNK